MSNQTQPGSPPPSPAAQPDEAVQPDVGLPPYSQQQPANDLDSLLAEWDERTAAPRPPPPDAAANLAEVQQRNADRWEEIQGWKRAWDERYVEVQPILDAHDRHQEAVALATEIEGVRKQYGLEFVDDALIESAIASGNQSAIAALQNLDNNFRSHASRNDIERAVLATRNSSTNNAPERPTLDVKRAVNASDQEWEEMKRSYIANGGR